MKFILLACLFGVAVCAPAQMFMEFDIRQAPAEAVQAIPPGASLDAVEVILPVDNRRQIIRQPVQGFIRQVVPRDDDGDRSRDVYYAFGFNQPAAPAVVAPVAPVAPVYPYYQPAAVQPIPAIRRSGDDDDEEDD